MRSVETLAEGKGVRREVLKEVSRVERQRKVLCEIKGE